VLCCISQVLHAISFHSDGVVRVFTNEPDRMASIDAILDFEEQVARSSVAAQQDLGGLKVADLPGPDALQNPGKKDGDTKMIREGGVVACYSWSEADMKWTKVGDVVGASGATQNTSGRVLHEGMVSCQCQIKSYFIIQTIS